MPRGSKQVPEILLVEYGERRARLGAAIRARRKEIGVTQQEVADALHLKHSSISLIERGVRQVQAHDIPEWMNILRVEPGWFVAQMLTYGRKPYMHNDEAY